MEFSENEKIFFQKALPTCCPSCIGAVPAFQRAEKDSSLSVPNASLSFKEKLPAFFRKTATFSEKTGSFCCTLAYGFQNP
ncbi:hypothetical protein [Phocaeicola faecicola]|uniref:hypothetical protein n=1 Tax=Phocaeicola faecicola TaxID=2739389 RepID=UPI002A7FC248|nr:hypothetical protein [Phocaeicola faecicola]MCI5743195.1 hypothetical protein [Bacteroides sp.]MDD6909513.1 hypothetical protein [Bacteroidaceae bacterium]MDY4870884.1 hypothetical protein [Phocaeicola faecicola]